MKEYTVIPTSAPESEERLSLEEYLQRGRQMQHAEIAAWLGRVFGVGKKPCDLQARRKALRHA